MSRFAELAVETGRIVRFGIVGLIATVTYATATFIAVEWLRIDPVPASILGQGISTPVSYFGHAWLSFQVKADHRTILWRFLVIGAVTFGLNGAVTHLFTHVFSISNRITIIVVTILIPLVNYLCNRFWVFRPGLRTPPTHRGLETL
jgi:putative flippase GtrA